MANTTTEEASYTQENSKDDECRENIPPGITPSGQRLKLEVHIDETEGRASINQDAEFESCISSTPAPTNNNVKAKSRLSGIQSALTPILKYLNIGNKGSSPETSAQGNNAGRTVSVKTARALSQRSELTSNCSRQQPGDTEISWLADECLPDITLLDATCDTTMLNMDSDVVGNATARKDCLSAMQKPTSDKQESRVITPRPTCTLSSNPPKMEIALTVSNTSSHDSHHSSWEKLSFSEVCSSDSSHAKAEPAEMSKYDGSGSSKDPTTKMSDLPDRIDASLCFLDSRLFPEITLLDVTCDSVSSPQSTTPSIKVAPNIPSVENLQRKHPSSEKSLDVTQELNTSNLVQNEDSARPVENSAGNKLNACSEQPIKCVGEKISKTSLETTRDISIGSFLEDSRHPVESNSQSLDKIQTVLEAVCGNPANLTRDISSSSIASAPSDTQCSMNAKNATFDLDEPTASMNAACEARPRCLDGDLSSEENLTNPKGPKSANGTFMIAEQVSNVSANNATPKLRSQNQTLELLSNPRAETDTKDESLPVINNTNRTPAISNSCPAVKPGPPCAPQNVTFERHSVQRSTSSIIVGEGDAATSGLENNTFDVKSSKQNATIKMCETSSSNSQQSSLERHSPLKSCPATGSPKGNNSELPLATEHNATKSDTTSEAKTVCTPEGKCKSDPPIHVDSDVSVHQSLIVEENRGSTFCLDETLDLREEHLITSTPMVDSKMLNFNAERDQGKMPAQKKLYRDLPGMPNGQLSSNIVSDRKTLLRQPAAKSLQPPCSGMPVYNFRATTAGSKQPMSGIQKPRSNFLQSGIQRAPQALRPPAAKCAATSSASTDNSQVPSGSNPVMKLSIAKRHHLSKAEMLPIAKKKKIDAPLPSETLASSCATMNETKNLKRPATSHKHLPIKTPRVDVPPNTTEMPTSGNAVSKVRALKQPATRQMSQLPKSQGNGCAKCAMLEEQLKKVKEELLKYTKQAQD